MAQRNELQPKLKFSEFQGELLIKKSKEIFENSRLKGNNKLPIYSVTLNNGLVPRESLGRKMENAAKCEDNLYAKKDDLVYNMMRMWQGAIGKAEKDCMVSPAYIVLHPKENISSKYFNYYFLRERSIYLFWSYSYGLTSDRLRLYFKDFGMIPFAVPEISEQKKIVSFISSVDSKIEKLEIKKELLEKYKKGIMQKIFSQGIRFKDKKGEKYPTWEEKKLSFICTIQKGEQLNKEFLKEVEKYPSISGGVTPSGYTDKWNRKENSIIISEGGNSCGYVNYIKTKFWCGGHCYSLLDLKVNVNNNFLYQILKFNERKIMILRVGSGLPNIQKKDISNFKVYIPCVEEQEKIANFLSAIDRKIEVVGIEIDEMKEFKKGLLQQMFV